MSGKFDAVAIKMAAFVREEGQPITLTLLTDGTPADTSKPWLPGDATPQTWNTFGGFFPVAAAEGPPGGICYIPDFRAVVIDERFLLTLANGDVYTVKSAECIDPSGTKVLLWTLKVTLWPRPLMAR